MSTKLYFTIECRMGTKYIPFNRVLYLRRDGENYYIHADGLSGGEKVIFDEVILYLSWLTN